MMNSAWSSLCVGTPIGIARDVSATLDMTQDGFAREWQCSEIDRQGIGLFDSFLHFDQESDRFFSINGAMIVAEGEIHHRANNDRSIDRDRSLHDFVHAQYSALRRIQNWSA